MLKIYAAKCAIHISVVLPSSGKSVHVSFSPKTNGESVFYTDDEDLQIALERHCRFGKLFKVTEVGNAPEAVNENIGVMDGDGKGQKGYVVPISCLEDAKDYLCDKFLCSRTKLRSKKNIVDAAEGYGIVFDGI